MAVKRKAKRKYLIYLERGISALLSGIDRINSISDPYRVEASLILLTNGWELMAKSLLLRDDKISILYSDGRSLSVEDSIAKLVEKGFLKENEAQHIQQIISLRNAAVHSVLPKIPDEILFHLEFYCVKFFKDLINKEFPSYSKYCSKNFLAISFDTFTTYADKVQKLVSKAKRKGTQEQELMWLLERGIRFKGGHYLSQDKFESEVKSLGKKKKLYHHLHVSDFIKDAQMVVIVPVQAPKGYTADINLRKGSSKAGSALPVMIKKTDMETDYPFLTAEIASTVGKSTSFVAKTFSALNIKNNPAYHQSIRSSRSGGIINRYSQKTLDLIVEKLRKEPSYNPYK
jgi:hypothetical protein